MNAKASKCAKNELTPDSPSYQHEGETTAAAENRP